MKLKEISERTRAMLSASVDVAAMTGGPTGPLRIYPVAAPRGAASSRSAWVTYRHKGTADQGSADGPAFSSLLVELTVAASTMDEALSLADACRAAMEKGDDKLDYTMADYEEDYDEGFELFVCTLTFNGL